jgi:hypothetical protein
MTVAAVREALAATVLTPGRETAAPLRGAIASDMMSDVLAFGASGSLLLTGSTNPQSVRTAELADIVVICYVQGKRPSPASVALATEKGIQLLATDCSLFEACGRLHAAGLRECAPRT